MPSGATKNAPSSIKVDMLRFHPANECPSFFTIGRNVRPSGLTLLTGRKSRQFLSYKLIDAWKAARHCRDTMHAYEHLAEQKLSLNDLEAAQREYKSHRCVVDSVDGILKQRNEMVLTAHQTKMIERTQVRRQNDTLREKSLTKHHKDMRSYILRKQRYDTNKK